MVTVFKSFIHSLKSWNSLRRTATEVESNDLIYSVCHKFRCRIIVSEIREQTIERVSKRGSQTLRDVCSLSARVGSARRMLTYQNITDERHSLSSLLSIVLFGRYVDDRSIL